MSNTRHPEIDDTRTREQFTRDALVIMVVEIKRRRAVRMGPVLKRIAEEVQHG